MRRLLSIYLLLLMLVASAGVNAQSHVSVGTPAGSFAVSPMGGASYSIPIDVPAGIGGMEPRVSIDYNSQSGNGLCGFGCNIGGGVLAVSNNGGAYQFYYIHTDHQGSILAVTDAQGSYVFKASYDAWGRQTVTVNTLAFQRGYTGHEMMKEGGLINMNGRIYDSICENIGTMEIDSIE